MYHAIFDAETGLKIGDFMCSPEKWEEAQKNLPTGQVSVECSGFIDGEKQCYDLANTIKARTDQDQQIKDQNKKVAESALAEIINQFKENEIKKVLGIDIDEPDLDSIKEYVQVLQSTIKNPPDDPGFVLPKLVKDKVKTNNI